MKLGEHQEVFTRHLVMLLTEAFKRGYEVRMGEVQRMPEMQTIYVKTGRSKTMNSAHLSKLAADLHFMKDGVLCYPEEMGRFWESLDSHNQAGMFWKSFKDGPHFERKI